MAAALTVLAGCGSGGPSDRAARPATTTTSLSSDPTPSTTGTGEVTAEVTGFRFEPEVIRLATGAAVRWTNADEVRHTVTADDGSFDVGLAGAGGSAGHRFAVPGTYAYHCDVHPSMTGTIVVG